MRELERLIVFKSSSPPPIILAFQRPELRRRRQQQQFRKSLSSYEKISGAETAFEGRGGREGLRGGFVIAMFDR